MAGHVLIFGKNTWPYTTSAREAYEEKGYQVDYHDVVADKSKLDEMLKHSNGGRSVPVIVEGAKVTIGYGGS